MFKKKSLFIACIFFQICLALNIQVKEVQQLDQNSFYTIYTATEFPLIIHVVTLPISSIDIKLVSAAGQREEVSSIAKRSNAFIAINGSNYRRGGKYNGNRLNLFYLHNQIYSDLGFIRGSFAWKTQTKTAIIDKIFLKTNLLINNRAISVDQINQPRIFGRSILYTENADISLLAHTPGTNIIIDQMGIIQDVTCKTPSQILPGWFVYQTDKNCCLELQSGMRTKINFEIKSFENASNYINCDFVLGGAGLLIKNGQIITDQLYDEFNQGSEVVHCHDEVAADFHTKQQQEWLIEQRHPRTAIGIIDKNNICIVVVNGRQENSAGLTLHELALFMQQLGCTNALNIGGGGCSTLYINEKVVNNPSGHEERPVSEALCFFTV